MPAPMAHRLPALLAGFLAAITTVAWLPTGCGGKVVHDDPPADASAPAPVPPAEVPRIPCPVPEPTPAGPPCSIADDCFPETYCDFADNRCGQGALGQCVPIARGCEFDVQEACACGGKPISNVCTATWGGVDVSVLGDCSVQDGSRIRCGWRLCRTADEYCRLTDAEFPFDAQCLTLPDACSTASADCSCLADEPCRSACEGTAASGFTVTCACE